MHGSGEYPTSSWVGETISWAKTAPLAEVETKVAAGREYVNRQMQKLESRLALVKDMEAIIERRRIEEATS